MQPRAEPKLGRALLASPLIAGFILACIAGVAFAGCDDHDPTEEAKEAVKKVERTVEKSGEAIREQSADGSLLVQKPAAPDAGQPFDR
jgi:hypothetical protein